MYRTDHYAALMTNLSNERQRLEQAASEAEYALRAVWVKQLEREVEAEIDFLASKGVNVYHVSTLDSTEVGSMSDDDLLNELLG